MADINSKNPLQDGKDALQKESGNPVDFKMHDTVRSPDINFTAVQEKATVGDSSPVNGNMAIDPNTKPNDVDAEAAKNRAMKQGLAGV